jgi:hypothetical protein
MGSLGAFTQPGCDCAEPPKLVIATEASTNAVTNDFIIFVTPYFCMFTARREVHGVAASVAARYFALRKKCGDPASPTARRYDRPRAKDDSVRGKVLVCNSIELSPDAGALAFFCVLGVGCDGSSA